MRSIRVSNKVLYENDFVPAKELKPSEDTILLYDFTEASVTGGSVPAESGL